MQVRISINRVCITCDNAPMRCCFHKGGKKGGVALIARK